jgi:hypothetical protein
MSGWQSRLQNYVAFNKNEVEFIAETEARKGVSSAGGHGTCNTGALKSLNL